MSRITKVNEYRLALTAKVAKSLCREKAIDCGYAALAAAIEGKAWERSRNINLMRRLVEFANVLEAMPIGQKNGTAPR